MDGNLDDRELLWSLYNLHIDLYKYYMDLALRANIFFYAITGGILSFSFTRTEKYIWILLTLPFLMSIAFSIIFLYGDSRLKILANGMQKIRERLNIDNAPEVRVLGIFLRVFGIIFIFVAISILILPFLMTVSSVCL